MPKIPRAADIGRTQVSGQQQVHVADISAVGTGAAAMGDVLGGIAKDNHIRKTNYEVSQARTEFLKAKTKEDNAYADDEDYGTMGDRYNNNMTTNLEEAGALINDPSARAEFVNNASVQLTQGHERIKLHAKRVETDYQRGYVAEGMDSNREAALNGDTMAAMAANDELIDSSIDMDYLSAEEGAKMKMDWRNDTAVSKIEMMDPRDRVEALNEPWAENIPTDVRAAIVRDANKENDLGQAIEAVVEVRDLGPTEAYAQLESMNLEPVVQVEAERRLDTHFAREKRNGVAEQEELHRSYFNAVRLEGMSVDTIPPEELAKMDPVIVNSMKQAERNYASEQDPTTPRMVTDTLNALYQGGKGKPGSVREYFMDVAHLMSRSDYETWSKTTTDSFGDLESDAVFTGTQMINDKIMEVNDGEKDDEMTSHYRRKFEKYVFDYRDANEGDEPSGQDQRVEIDRMMLEVPTREQRGPGKAPAGYTLWDDMDSAEGGEALNYLEQLDPEAFAEARRVLSQDGTTSFRAKDLAYLFTTMSDADDRGAYEAPAVDVTTEPYVQADQPMPPEIQQIVGKNRPEEMVERMGQSRSYNDPLAIFHASGGTD